jgi:hypothetical protein
MRGRVSFPTVFETSGEPPYNKMFPLFLILHQGFPLPVNNSTMEQKNYNPYIV